MPKVWRRGAERVIFPALRWCVESSLPGVVNGTDMMYEALLEIYENSLLMFKSEFWS